jgi:ATP-dependent Lon protease
MAAATERIPLFPLAVVLFPQSQVPLHIFEERYKKLIAECLVKGSTFGINFIENNKLHSIGCTARVAEVTKRYPDGKLDIVTEGIKRYQIVSVDDPGTYDELLYANVSWIEDKKELRDTNLANETIRLFNELCDVAYKGTIDAIDSAVWGDVEKMPSFIIAQKSGLEPDQRQALLGITSENERLSILKNFLSQLLPRVREIEKINDLVRNDGYIVTWNKKK